MTLTECKENLICSDNACVCATAKDRLSWHHFFHRKSCFQNSGFPLCSRPRTQLTSPSVFLCPTHYSDSSELHHFDYVLQRCCSHQQQRWSRIIFTFQGKLWFITSWILFSLFWPPSQLVTVTWHSATVSLTVSPHWWERLPKSNINQVARSLPEKSNQNKTGSHSGKENEEIRMERGRWGVRGSGRGEE